MVSYTGRANAISKRETPHSFPKILDHLVFSQSGIFRRRPVEPPWAIQKEQVLAPAMRTRIAVDMPVEFPDAARQRPPGSPYVDHWLPRNPPSLDCVGQIVNVNRCAIVISTRDYGDCIDSWAIFNYVISPTDWSVRR